MKIAVQMDHISTIHIAGDTTFALCLEAQRRGAELFHYTPDRLSLRGGVVSANCEALTVRDVEGDHFTLEPCEHTNLSQMDVVLLRQDPPFDMHYITTTHILERIHPKTLVVNNPISVRNAPEKILVTQFPDLMPETLITKDLTQVLAFRREFGDIIIKPLYGNGGSGVFHLTPTDDNLTALVEMFDVQYREAFIVQRYLPQVREGDKRIILIDGKAVGAVNRVPRVGDARSNMHVGGQAQKTDLTPREYEICAKLEPVLKQLDFILVGIDVIGGLITEINVTSPTGLREIKKFDGIDIASLFWESVEARKGLTG